MELQKVINSLPTKGLSKAYQADIKQFHKFTNGGPINQDIVMDYFKHMEDIGRKFATVNRHKSALKKAIIASMGNTANLVELSQIDQFFKKIKAGKRDIAITKDKTLSKEELSKLISCAGHKTGLIIRALYETAARVSELCSIRLSDCEVRGSGVIINTIGKGKKQRQFYINKDLYDEIRAAYKSPNWLFGNGKPLSRVTVFQLVQRAAKKIGRPDISPHNLRHSWATLSIQSLGLAKVSGYLGHADTSTTAKFYLHGKPEMSDIMSINQLNQSI